MSEQTLLPCPFCGTAIRDDEQELSLPAWLQLNEIAGPLFSIECFGCGVEMRYADSAAEAIAAWNRRHPECRHGRQTGDDCGLCELQGPDRLAARAPSLAEVQALAARCKAGELGACAEYQEAAKALLDDIRSTLHEDSEREAERERLRLVIVDLETELLNARGEAPC